MQRNDKDGQHQEQLDVDDFKGMNCGHREHCRLLVFVVHLVEVLVEERGVIDAMNPVGGVVLVEEDGRNLQEQPPPAVLGPVVVEGEQGAPIVSVRGYAGGDHAGEHQREAAKQDLVPLQVGRHELIRLAFPLLGLVLLSDVEEPLVKGWEIRENLICE